MAQLDGKTQLVVELLKRRGISETYQTVDDLARDLNAGQMVAEVGGNGHVLFLQPYSGTDYRAIIAPMNPEASVIYIGKDGERVDIKGSQAPMIDMVARIWASCVGAKLDHFEFNDKNRQEHWDVSPVKMVERNSFFRPDSGVIYMKVNPSTVSSFRT